MRLWKWISNPLSLSVLVHVVVVGAVAVGFLARHHWRPGLEDLDVRTLTEEEFRALPGGARALPASESQSLLPQKSPSKPRPSGRRQGAAAPVLSELLSLNLRPAEMFRGSGALSVDGNVPHAESSTDDSASSVPNFKSAPYEAFPGAAGVGAGAISGRETPLLQQLGYKLHENTTYRDVLTQRRVTGQVTLRMRALPTTQMVPGTLQVHCADRLLGAYIIKSVEEALAYASGSLTSRDGRGILVNYDFLFISDPRVPRLPTLRISRGMILISRFHYDPVQINMGALNFLKAHENSGPSGPGLSMGFEFESLFSRKHRKRYGWDGAKVARQVGKLEIEDLRQRAERYLKEGKLFLSRET